MTFKLEWKKCPCGHAICKRQYPSNIGTFYQGSGFDPEEVALLDRAFAALAWKAANKGRYPQERPPKFAMED